MSENFKPYAGLTEIQYKSLPIYIQKDIEAFELGIKTNSTVLDCLYEELRASINSAKHGYEISQEMVDHLWNEYIE